MQRDSYDDDVEDIERRFRYLPRHLIRTADIDATRWIVHHTNLVLLTDIARKKRWRATEGENYLVDWSIVKRVLRGTSRSELFSSRRDLSSFSIVSAERRDKGAPRRRTFSESFVALSLVVLLLGVTTLNPSDAQVVIARTWTPPLSRRLPAGSNSTARANNPAWMSANT